MVQTNTAYLRSLPGMCKIATIILVIISISLGGHAFENSFYNLAHRLEELFDFPLSNIPGLGRERFFLAIMGIILTISVISLVCHTMNVGFLYDRNLKLMDVVYHVLAAVFLLVVGSLIIASSRKINNDICKNWNWNVSTTMPPTFPTTEFTPTTTTTTTTHGPTHSTDSSSMLTSEVWTTTENPTTSGGETTIAPSTLLPTTENPTTMSAGETTNAPSTLLPTTEESTQKPTTDAPPGSTGDDIENPTSTLSPSLTSTEDTATDAATEDGTASTASSSLAAEETTTDPESPDAEKIPERNGKSVEDAFQPAMPLTLEVGPGDPHTNGVNVLSYLLQSKLLIEEDEGYHLDFAILADQFNNVKCQYRGEKEVAGSFAIVGSLLFAFVAVILFLRLNTLPDPSPPDTMMHDVPL